MPRSIHPNPGMPLGINVTCPTPDVLAYRLWTQQPGQPWVILGTGSTSDNISDFYASGPHPLGTKIVYLFRFGGNPNTFYRGILNIAQDGHILPDGVIIEEGFTDEDGLAAHQDEIVIT